MYLFFYMALGLNDFDAGKSITRAIGNGGWAQKSLDFQGPPLPMALEVNFPASKSLRPAPYNQQVH